MAFEMNSRAIRRRPGNFELQSSDKDDTRAGMPLSKLPHHANKIWLSPTLCALLGLSGPLGTHLKRPVDKPVLPVGAMGKLEEVVGCQLRYSHRHLV
ncbi:hypothetical protein TNCV_1175851 [Trichonephila clavipes]|nr:hypothetical protein TNCV_1175851 [Trichonephila clavipes]